MEPIKRDGKIREQIQIEDRIRREYDKKWGPVTSPEVTEFYNPDYLCRQFRQKYKKDIEKWPYVYDEGHGDSHFVSKEMYNELLAKCRCGRPRTEGHILRTCRQRSESLEAPAGSSSSLRVPQTSSGIIGWPTPTYRALERSTTYISPKNSIPGGRIDDKPYSHIFIG